MEALTRNSNTELVKLPDCAGLRKDGRCQWLNVSSCPGEACSYCQGTSSLDKAYKRLGSLNEETHWRIAGTYDGGVRPRAENSGEHKRGKRHV